MKKSKTQYGYCPKNKKSGDRWIVYFRDYKKEVEVDLVHNLHNLKDFKIVRVKITEVGKGRKK